MPMYNLLEYSDNYSMAPGILWNYYRDEINDDENEIDDNAEKIYNNKTITSNLFKYKTERTGSTQDNANRLNAKVVVPWKYLSNSWRSLYLLLINCELELDLRWARNCVISEVFRTFRVVPDANPVASEVVTQTTSASFQINNANLYVPVVTVSINDNIKF